MERERFGPRRILVAIELRIHGFRHPWRLAAKLMRSLREADQGEFIEIDAE